jgi:hypothetical protein
MMQCGARCLFKDDVSYFESCSGLCRKPWTGVKIELQEVRSAAVDQHQKIEQQINSKSTPQIAQHCAMRGLAAQQS